MKIKTLTVSEVNNYLKRIIDNDFILNNLSVKGEISNLKYHSSGHIYFSLKDSFGKLNCVMFRGKAEDLTFKLEPNSGKQMSFSQTILFRFEQETTLQVRADILGNQDDSNVVVTNVNLVMKKIHE